MSDQDQNQSYIGTPDYNTAELNRTISRQIRLDHTRPLPVRALRIVNGALAWDPPQNTNLVTHYNIYGDDEKTVLRRVAVGQNAISEQLTASTFSVTSFNKATGIQSVRVYLQNGAPTTIPTAARGTTEGSGATITPNLALGKWHQITLVNATTTINLPINALAWQELSFLLVQDATGGRLVTWNAAYEGLSIGDIDTTLSTYSVYEFVLRADLTPILCRRPLTGLPWV